MHTGFITIAAGALVLAATSPATSHHPSGTGTSKTGGPIVTIPGTTLQKGASALYVIYEHYSFDELSNSVLEAAAGRHEHVHSLATIESPALGYSYGLTDRLMVSVQLPYVVRTGIREGAHQHDEITAVVTNETVDRGDTDGIGDLTFFGQYRFYGQDSGGYKPLSLPASRRPLERQVSTTTKASCLKLSSNRVPALGTRWLGSLSRGLRAGGRWMLMLYTRLRRKGHNTPILVTASIITAR